MSEIDIYKALSEVEEAPKFSMIFGGESEHAEIIAQHRTWLQNIRHERPLASTPYKVGIYIRYFNQTKYENYLDYHIKNFRDAISLCPEWDLVDFYIDEGSSTPNIENAPELCRLLDDCFSNKVNLIITQKVSNISKKANEITLLSRLLATQKEPIGIYFVSEDIFTMSSYYMTDLKDLSFIPDGWEVIEDCNNTHLRGELHD